MRQSAFMFDMSVAIVVAPTIDDGATNLGKLTESNNMLVLSSAKKLVVENLPAQYV